jgi:hypothetical protein
VVLTIPTTTSRRCSSCYSQGNWSYKAPSHYREHETGDKPPHIICDASTSPAYVTNETGGTRLSHQNNSVVFHFWRASAL